MYLKNDDNLKSTQKRQPGIFFTGGFQIYPLWQHIWTEFKLAGIKDTEGI